MQAITSCVCQYKLASVSGHEKGAATSLTPECQGIIGECAEEVGQAKCNVYQLRPHSIGRTRSQRFRQGTYGNNKQPLMWFPHLLWINVIITVKLQH